MYTYLSDCLQYDDLTDVSTIKIKKDETKIE